MRIVRGRLYAFALPLLEPLRTAHAVVRVREGFVVELSDETGRSGYGEATPLPSFGGETSANCAAELRRALHGALVSSDLPEARTVPVARCAIECARLDLEARRRGLSLASWLTAGSAADGSDGADAAGPADSVRVNALVSGRDEGAIAREVERLAPSGYETWKLKVGAAALADDLDRVRALRAALGPNAKIRLDANGAWNASEASAALNQFAASEIELLEQPLAPGDPLALAKLRAASPIRIAADESIVDRASLRALLAAEAVDVVALKLPVLGGATAALGLAAEARERGIEAYVTSFLDSSLGIAAALQVAASLPRSELAHGLATAALLARDLATAPRVVSGELPLPRGEGLGLVPDRDALGEPVAEVRA